MRALTIETSVREAIKMAAVLRDVNLESIFDAKVLQIHSNVWVFSVEDVDDDEFEEIQSELNAIFISSRLNEFEVL